MQNQNTTSRRSFVAGCICSGCAGLACAAQPSSRNTKSLKPATTTSTATKSDKRNFDIAYCGIYCAACELQLKGKQDGKKCKGCTHPSMESKCAVFTCAKKKKVANCGLCESFESCDILQKHHEKPLYRQVARKTCTTIKADGMTATIAAQKTRWTCKACNKLFPWNNTSGACPHCGKEVDKMSDKDA